MASPEAAELDTTPRLSSTPRSETSHLHVAVRCRPPLPHEAAAEGADTCAVSFPGGSRLVLRHNGEDLRHNFDRVFGPDTTQEQIFETLGAPQLDQALQGFNSTIFAYGQTGGGKTFTMMNLHAQPELQGLIPRLGVALFQRISESRQKHETRRFLVQCSLLEIYNEVIHDLLAPRQKELKRGGLEVKEQKGIGVYVCGLTEAVVEEPAGLNQIINEGFENRVVGTTKMNDVSSRSHCVLTLTLHQKDAEDSSKNTVSKVNMVDLAGSERVKATGAEGARATEGANINKSLSALGNVITSLSAMAGGSKKKVFIPYRDSKLTRVLQESLGGNALCTMIATISPSSLVVDETLSTLNFARRAKAVRVVATKNEEASQMKLLQQEVESLRQLKELAHSPSKAALGFDEQAELDNRQKAQLEVLQSHVEQSWEDKQKLSREMEAARERAREETTRAFDQLRTEKRRRVQMLEQHGEIHLTLQTVSVHCLGWPDRISEALKVGQQLRSELRAVRLYRESVGTDFVTLWDFEESEVAATSTLLGPVQGKLESLSKELDALIALDGQLEEQMGRTVPEVVVALHHARQEVASASDLASSDAGHATKEELVELLELVLRQLTDHYAKEHRLVRREIMEMNFAADLQQLARRLGSQTVDCSTEGGDSFAQPELRRLLEELQGAGGSASSSHGHDRAEDAVSDDYVDQLPRVLGLSTSDVPDSCLSASSNSHIARHARLLHPYGGWCPNVDAPDQYLEIDLTDTIQQEAVAGLSIQGRVPCTGSWEQTRELLRLVLDPSESLLLNSPEGTFVRPPVRFVYDIASTLVQKHSCLGCDNALQFPALADMPKKEQKLVFFEELIKMTLIACDSDGLMLKVTPQDILSGKNCEETHRLLQLLCWLGMSPPDARLQGGLGSVEHQWTSAWKLEYLDDQGAWRWYGTPGEDSAHIFEGNEDAISIKFVRLAEPVVASRLRIHPVRWHRHPALRCEVHVIQAASKEHEHPQKARHHLKSSVELMTRGIREFKRNLEGKEKARIQRKSILEEQADQERGQLELRSKNASMRAETLETRAVAAETGLLQARAENERLLVQVEQLQSELAAWSEARGADESFGSELQAECEELRSTIEELNQEVLVVTDERDVARDEREEIFKLMGSREDELQQADAAYVDLTERFTERALEKEATDLFASQMDQFATQLDEMQTQHEEDTTRCTGLEEQVNQLSAENQKLEKKRTKLKKAYKELEEKLAASEEARQFARERAEKMLARADSQMKDRRSGSMSGSIALPSNKARTDQGDSPDGFRTPGRGSPSDDAVPGLSPRTDGASTRSTTPVKVGYVVESPEGSPDGLTTARSAQLTGRSQQLTGRSALCSQRDTARSSKSVTIVHSESAPTFGSAEH